EIRRFCTGRGGPHRDALAIERGRKLRRPQSRRRRSLLMISRRSFTYSSMIRRASSERDSLGGSSLPWRGSLGGFILAESARTLGVSIELNQSRTLGYVPVRGYWPN